jgi:hypothetical protein
VIAAGINIIHINTELRVAWRRGLEEGLTKQPDEVVPHKILPFAVEAVKEVEADEIAPISRLPLPQPQGPVACSSRPIACDGESSVSGTEGFAGSARHGQIDGLWIVYVGIVWSEIDRSIGLPQHLGVVVGRGVTPPKEIFLCRGVGASCQSLGVVGVDLERAVEQGSRLDRRL